MFQYEVAISIALLKRYSLFFYHNNIMSDFKRQLPTRDELCSDIVLFLGARETRRQRIKALQTEIEKVNHY